ncbi:winged helix-turn-helix domain-containing protein [Priestia aryabhattai]|uniref:helix-turn-helix domain-containing protein n=1 Tax=Priestia TaxID=2800373 RepID=UPI0004704976|nr:MULTISPECIES: helix-turn-helix domain-containing protein [Priestia]MBX9968912.1 winged helix-turn-helix domain-containing protein [Priestia aryabhattai]MED3955683.1 helix-turn-helix domain-containing protein [Priestia aryabhattai]MED4154339.1 helix-turn-helix domain-containing protein [Priestia aryabhattai]PFA95897.1 MarR family transcriptional regulator [Priestia megaterium]
MQKALQEAEKKARLREIENDKVLTDQELELANDLQAKANAGKMKLVPERQIKNRARFVQFLQLNWRYLRKENYLSSEEKVFLVDIQSQIGLHSNAIVDDVNKKNASPLNITQIAELLGTSRPKVSRVVNSLVKKGILAKAESGIEDNNVKAYAIYINPNIIYAGNKDDVQGALITMFKKPMNNKVLKHLPDRLF